MNIILASGSPRRKELLEKAKLDFSIVVSSVEEIHDESINLERLCMLNAKLKASDVAQSNPDYYVIGADTLVYIDQTPLGKPKDLNDARNMLKTLSGRTHQVCTGVCVIDPSGVSTIFNEITEVEFLPLNDAIIDEYFSKMNPLDKAGSYGAQDFREMIIKDIRGEFDNVIGLPIKKLMKFLSEKIDDSVSPNVL
jgi:septum formation protein